MVAASVSAFASNTYYIDYSAGADGNNGTSKSTPWKHHPYMAGWTGSYSHVAGDHFIFKGGVTWPYTSLPLSVSTGGTNGNPDYYGVDQTWYTGSSWARPIFNFGGTSSPNGNTIALGASYVTLDNIEMTNLYWTTAVGGANVAYVYVSGASGVTISNSYFHGWSHASTAGDNLKIILGATYAVTGTDIVTGCTFDGGDTSGENSGMATYTMPVIRNSIARNMANGFLVWSENGGSSAYAEVSGNTIGPINVSFDSNEHTNSIEDVGVTGTLNVFNNVVHDSMAVALFIGGSGAVADNIYNNVIYNNTHVGPAPIDLEVRAAMGNISVYNNTITDDAGTYCVGPSTTSDTGGALKIENNYCISSHGMLSGSYSPITNSNNLVQTSATASAQGYTASNLFKPTSATATTVGAGLNLTSLGMTTLDSDLLAVARPGSGAWDAGAYEYGSGTVTAPSAPSAPTIVSAVAK